jgi:ABC-type siderophore export system fused ATPase/permease subunit
MRLLILLLQVSKIRLAIVTLASMISGLSTVASLICVLQSLRGTDFLWWQFICFAALAVASTAYARMSIGSLVGASVLRLRRRMLRSIVRVPLEEFEQIGASQLLVGFTTDLANIGTAVGNFVRLVSGAAFLVACLAYLAWLSPERAAVASCMLLLTIAV